MNKRSTSIAVCFLIFLTSVHAQTKKAQLQFLGAFDAGQEGVNIYKMYDGSDSVICYLLMPETVGRRPVDDSGKKWIYDGNSIGAISCVRTRTDISVNGPIANDLNQSIRSSKNK